MVALVGHRPTVLRSAQSGQRPHVWLGAVHTALHADTRLQVHMAPNAGKGSIAQQLASIPLKGEQKVDTPNGTAGKDVAAAIREAAIASSVESAAEASKEIRSLIEILGTPKFLMGDQKPYPDKRVANKVNRKMAVAAFVLTSGIELHANVYADDTLIGTADKDNNQEAEREFRVSVPKAIYVDRNNASAVLAASAWQQHTMNLYDEWADTVAASTPVQQSTAPRLVKKVTLVGAALPKPAATKPATT